MAPLGRKVSGVACRLPKGLDNGWIATGERGGVSMHSVRTLWAAKIACLLVVAVVYWPVLHGQFVWDDVVDFAQMAWLRQGDAWWRLIFHGFNNWTHYFRPLGVAFFTLQVRLFGAVPGPMHAVSLLLHLLDTLLVGVLARRLVADRASRTQLMVTALAMLAYGLHPLLTEPVAWIGSQFDLLVNLLLLLGLWAHLALQGRIRRALAVSACFFLAACTKESAAAFPLLLLLFDAMEVRRDDNLALRQAAKAVLSRSGVSYALVLLAGFVYLGLRHAALGQMLPPAVADHALTSIGHLQEIAFLYLRYWQMLCWPMSGISPIHPVDPSTFNAVTASSLLLDLGALGLVVAGCVLAIWRRSWTGAFILAVSAALLPVLHIAAADFDESLYHERYAALALALACVLGPRAVLEWRLPAATQRLATLAGGAVFALWLLLGAANVRLVLPLWSSNLALWQWALHEHPDAVEARDGLLSAYIDSGDYGRANRFIDQLARDRIPCVNCMLNAAILALLQNDLPRAEAALDRVDGAPELASNAQMKRAYLQSRGRLLLQQGKPAEAEPWFRSAIELDRLDPEPQIALALTLSLEGKPDEARRVAEAAIPLLSPEERASRQQALDRLLSPQDAAPAH